MKLTNKQWMVIGGIILIIFIGSNINQKEAEESTLLNQGCVLDENGEMLCFEFFLSNEKKEGISPSPSNPEPGEQVTATFDLTIDLAQEHAYNSYVEYAKIKVLGPAPNYLEVYQIWNFETSANLAINNAGGCLHGCSITLVVYFNAPYTEGDYTLEYNIIETDGISLSSGTAPLTVGTTVTNCPSDTQWTSWQTQAYISNGVQQIRSMKDYHDNPPDCTFTTHEEYRTVCDTGYIVDGYTTQIASGFHQCVEQSTTEPDSCVDNDGGLNYNSKASVFGYSNNEFYTFYDYCEGSVLHEGICDGVIQQEQVYNCEYGCSDGECLSQQSEPDSCVDNDGGLVYYSKSSIFGYDNGVYYQTYDFCEGAILQEMNCVGTVPHQQGYDCPHGCSDGECLPSQGECAGQSDGTTCTLSNNQTGMCEGGTCTMQDTTCPSPGSCGTIAVADKECGQDNTGYYFCEDIGATNAFGEAVYCLTNFYECPSETPICEVTYQGIFEPGTSVSATCTDGGVAEECADACTAWSSWSDCTDGEKTRTRECTLNTCSETDTGVCAGSCVSNNDCLGFIESCDTETNTCKMNTMILLVGAFMLLSVLLKSVSGRK